MKLRLSYKIMFGYVQKLQIAHLISLKTINIVTYNKFSTVVPVVVPCSKASCTAAPQGQLRCRAERYITALALQLRIVCCGTLWLHVVLYGDGIHCIQL